MSTPDATAPTITVAQYRAALDALGLDPDRVVNLTLSGQWVQITEIVQVDGHPVVELGQPVTVQTMGPLVTDQPGGNP